jgi:eukaryotic-like serine/threonine-protein kinase
MDSATWLDLLHRSQIVAPESLQPVLDAIELANGGQLPANAIQLSDEMVKAGLVSTWQANHLLQSRWQGFFLGRYKIIKPLGRGGMGTVYLAEHRLMGHRVAIKVLPKERLSTPGMLERFRNEARTAAMLDHVNIVRSVDFSVHEGQPYIVMEYVAGRDLHKAVYQDGPFSIDAAIRVCAQAAAGLGHAHERGIIHRDIKPSNLLINETGVLKILDMGLAHFKHSTDPQLTADGNGSILGTADFLSPEQALSSRGVDGRSDLYSLGCTLCFVLTGKPPFPAENLVQRLTLHQTAAPPDLCQERSDCPPALNGVFQKLMAKRPEDRFGSGEELLLVLKKLKDCGLGGASAAPTRKAVHRTASSPRDTRSSFLDDTGAGASPSSSDKDLFSNLSLPPVGSSKVSAAMIPPAYLSSSGSDYPLPPAATVQPRTGSGVKSNSRTAAMKRESNFKMRDLYVVAAFSCFIAILSVGAIAYWLMSSRTEARNNFSRLIRQSEGGLPSGSVIIIKE